MTMTNKEAIVYRIEVYHDEDNGWCAEITDDGSKFAGIAIGRTEDDARRKAQDMIEDAIYE